MPIGEGDQMPAAVGGGDQTPTGEGDEMPAVGVHQVPTGEGDQMSAVGGAQLQGDRAAHDELQERCFACNGNHMLLCCDAKWSCQPPGMFGMSTEKPFYYIAPSEGTRGNIPHHVGDSLARAWFRVFGVPGITRTWEMLFQTASSVGLLVDVDIDTLDGNRSNCIRMLIDLASTNGAPFFACIVYGYESGYFEVRFELEEV